MKKEDFFKRVWTLGTVLSLCLTLLSACSKTAQNSTPPADSVDQGNSSGGGGFGDESSMDLLNWTKQLSARSMRQANPQVFAELPKGWNAERLAQLIENIHPEPNTVVYRYNRELMFDYKLPTQGEPYLIATSLFFRAFSSVPVRAVYPDVLEPYLREINTRLLHEAAHVLGIGQTEKTDYKARVFANYLKTVLWKNNVICKTDAVPDDYPGKVQEADIQSSVDYYYKKYTSSVQRSDELTNKVRAEINQKPYYWMVNRPFGFGLQMRKFYEGEVIRKDDLFSNLLNGIPSLGNRIASYPLAANGEHNPELERAYFPAYWGSETRADREYYKQAEVSNGWSKFTGLFSQAPSSTYPHALACDASETIRIPQALSGTYSGFIDYSDTCSHVFDEKPSDRITGHIAVQCVESFQVLKNLAELYGDQELKDPELVEMIPDDSID